MVHGLHKIVIRSSFGVIWQDKASGGKWTSHHYGIRSHMNLER